MPEMSFRVFWYKKIENKIEKKFWLKIYDFSDIFYKMSKIPLFGPRNPLVLPKNNQNHIILTNLSHM